MNPRRLRSSAVRLVKYWRRKTTRQCSAKVVCCNRSTRMQPLDAIATETLLPAIEQRARDARFPARGAHADRDRAPNDLYSIPCMLSSRVIAPPPHRGSLAGVLTLGKVGQVVLISLRLKCQH